MLQRIYRIRHQSILWIDIIFLYLYCQSSALTYIFLMKVY